MFYDRSAYLHVEIETYDGDLASRRTFLRFVPRDSCLFARFLPFDRPIRK